MKSILYSLCALLCFGAVAGPVSAQRVSAEPGLLIIEDGAKLFSQKARSQAEEILRNHKTAPRTQLNIITFAELPPARAEAFAKVKGDRAKEMEFMRQWALEEARSNRDKGVVVLIAWDIKKLEILTDRSSRERGFNDSRESELKNILTSAFKDALTKEGEERAKVLDGALIKASQLVVDNIKSASGSSTSAAGEREAPAWTQWVCIGLAVLLGLWLIMGIIRGLSGGGGGGPGGGGGGFFSSMLGGLFGAAMGMYLYNSFFGGGMNSAYGDSGASGAGDAGEGDYSGSAGTGGDFGDAGGDFGGGGGDFGGGGDW